MLTANIVAQGEPKIIENIRKYAVFYGAGGVAALQALKSDIFSFPENTRMYLGYFFSIVTIFCIFLAGSSIVDLLRKVNTVVKKMNEIDSEAKDKKSDNP